MSVEVNTIVEVNTGDGWKATSEIRCTSIRDLVIPELVDNAGIEIREDFETANNRKFGATYDNLSQEVKDDAYVNNDVAYVILSEDIAWCKKQLNDEVREERREGFATSDKVHDCLMFKDVLNDFEKVNAQNKRLVVWFN